MADKVWKRREREIAVALNGRRIPVTGIDRAGADVVTPMFVVQSKHGRNRPTYLQEWLSGICGQAGPAQVGIVIWCANGERLADGIVLMKMSDFTDLHGRLEQMANGEEKGTEGKGTTAKRKGSTAATGKAPAAPKITAFTRYGKPRTSHPGAHRGIGRR